MNKVCSKIRIEIGQKQCGFVQDSKNDIFKITILSQVEKMKKIYTYVCLITKRNSIKSYTKNFWTNMSRSSLCKTLFTQTLFILFKLHLHVRCDLRYCQQFGVNGKRE